MSEKKLIIAVEDDEVVVGAYRAYLESRFDVEQAFTLRDVKSLVSRRNVEAIVLSGRRQRDLAGVDMVRAIREFFPGLMVAASGDPGLMSEMVRAGCNERAPKPEAPRILQTIFCLDPDASAR